MKKKIFSIICLVIYIFVCYAPIVVNAVESVDCIYDEAGLTISYDLDDNSNPRINSDFTGSEFYINFLLFKTGSSITSTDKIILDQTLYKKYTDGYVCPTKMYICTQTNYSINLPTLYGLGADVLLILTTVADAILEFGDWIIDAGEFLINLLPWVEVDSGNDLGGLIKDSFKEIVAEESYAAVTFDERNLYIYSEDEYKRSDISERETRLYNDHMEILDANLEIFCSGGDCNTWYWDILNYLFADLKTSLDLLIDLFTESEIVAFGYEQIDCTTVEYTGEYGSVDINCAFLTTSLFEYQDLIEKYKNCGDIGSCKGGVLNEMNQLESRINTGCDNVLQNYLYSETQKECIKSCLNLDTTLNELKKDTDLYNHGIHIPGPNECSLSARLASWIMKIVKWIRYIVPIMLVLLSVMDFIKAVANDSEDEIKKVGSKFVKRLIVALIIFLIPLILEFLLGIFDIGTNDYCLKG